MLDDLRIDTALPEDYVPTPEGGLTEAEAARRMEAGQGNAARADAGKSVWQILAGNLFTLFNLLNAALAAALIAVGSYRNLLFMGVVVSNTLIGAIQELRAQHTIRRLSVLNAPVVHVLREGRERACRPEELVRGDLTVMRSGDQVVADGVVRSGAGAANESLLTGESNAIAKHAGDWVMSGSYITEGRCVVELVRVGDESYANRLTRAARQIKRPRSALMNDLNRLLRFVSVILTPLGLLLFCKQYFLNATPLETAVPSTVAAMLGMIPEGLVLLTSMAMAVGVVRLGRRGTLVQELYGIETLARADVLCLDKTGTLTTGRMTVSEMLPAEADENELRASLSRFLGAFDARSGTLDALRGCVPPGTETPTAVLPFSSARKKSAASFDDGTTLILGAPTFVLGDRFSPPLRQAAEERAAQGARVLALAQARGSVTETDAPPVHRLLGLIFLEEEVRENAAQTLAYFREQGVTIKLISGDDPRTVSAIARRVALPGYDAWVDASTLTDDAALTAACDRCTVFGRVTPEQKMRLVEALKRAGHSVAMTGDGVNDIPALKAADCSIAMAGGSDAAKHAAQLTLLDADFSAMPRVVGEGRRVVNNITRAASLFLVKTLYSFALSVLMLFLPVAYPFQPIQLTLISTLTIGVPSFLLAMEPNRQPIRGRFLETVLSRAIPGAAAVTVCAALSMAFSLLGWSHGMCATLATLSAGAMGLVVLLRLCWPLTLARTLLVAAMTSGFVLTVSLLGRVFFLQRLGPQEGLALAGLLLVGLSALLATSWLIGRRLGQTRTPPAEPLGPQS